MAVVERAIRRRLLGVFGSGEAPTARGPRQRDPDLQIALVNRMPPQPKGVP